MSVDEMCRAAAETKDSTVPIIREQWDSGTGTDIALGPIVSGERICVRRDRFIYWRPAR